jgi:hypothetical protein
MNTPTATLNNIQKLQFSDKAAAEQMLMEFLRKDIGPQIVRVELLPKPESLNSINGYLTYSNQTRLFFKSHTEESEKLEEYYNASLLSKVGYPVICSKKVNTEPGQQIALYEIISLPTLFDLIKIEEDNLVERSNSELTKQLMKAQRQLDALTFQIYQETLEESSASENSRAPVHQLFIHRLHEKGRVSNFYSGKTLGLKDKVLPFEALASKRWIINGVTYAETLAELIDRARHSLEPKVGASVVGHGDAHNGNVFVDIENNKLLLFDPAFAGRHHPIIDMTKPLFHNVFARWMYHPQQVAQEFQLDVNLKNDAIVVNHTYQPSSIRLEILDSKIELVLKPTLAMLKNKGMLPDDWQTMLHSALFCCPFLTVNLLADYVPNGNLAERYPLAIKLLGLTMAIELSANATRGTSRLQEIIGSLF